MNENKGPMQQFLDDLAEHLKPLEFKPSTRHRVTGASITTTGASSSVQTRVMDPEVTYRLVGIRRDGAKGVPLFVFAIKDIVVPLNKKMASKCFSNFMPVLDAYAKIQGVQDFDTLESTVKNAQRKVDRKLEAEAKRAAEEAEAAKAAELFSVNSAYGVW